MPLAQLPAIQLNRRPAAAPAPGQTTSGGLIPVATNYWSNFFNQSLFGPTGMTTTQALVIGAVAVGFIWLWSERKHSPKIKSPKRYFADRKIKRYVKKRAKVEARHAAELARIEDDYGPEIDARTPAGRERARKLVASGRAIAFKKRGT